MTNSVRLDARVESLLDRLYEQHTAQGSSMAAYYAERAAGRSPNENWFDDRIHAFLRDKLVALDRPKAEFCYMTCRALRALRIVEVGTSYGVSTLFLASAVRDNAASQEAKTETPSVIATEHEAEKAKIARSHFAEAGLSHLIDLREGDLRQTLIGLEGPIDFALIDIWTAMARPALELVAPRLRTGGVVICDNTQHFRDAYQDYFAFVHDPRNGLRTMTLPFEGGLEFTVKVL
jgi:predicted O-methyltransferase YrrM